MRLLVIDDERHLVEQIVPILTGHGYEVVSRELGEEGLRLALSGGFALILLDVNLPDRDGWSVLAELRRERVATPVLFLSGFGEVHDRVKGLDLGADDYLTKPFDFRELLARVQAITRRAAHPNRIVAGELEVCLDSRRVTRAGKALHLSPHEFGALLMLVRKKGEVVTHDEIALEVLQRKKLGTSNSVEVLIRRLRLKVDARFDSELIRTVRGRGYAFGPALSPDSGRPSGAKVG